MRKIIRITSSQNYFFWIFVSIVIKILVLGFFVWQSHQLTPNDIVKGVVVKQNDYYMFLHPIDTYIKTGFYTLDGVRPFAGRMPGYSIPYFLLRGVFDQSNALLALILMQVFLSAISVYVLAKLAMLLLKNEKYFFITFFLFAISTYTSIFDIFTLAESFSISALIFSLYYLFLFFSYVQKKHLLYAGFFLAWLIFLRPFLGLVIVVFPAIVFLKYLRAINFRKAFIYCILFVLPFGICESAWVLRNYFALHKFIPLETSLDESYGKYGSYRSSAIAVRQLITSWGGETGEFYDNSEAWWFHAAKGNDIENYQFKKRVFKGNFNKDSLIYLKKIFNESGSKELSNREKDSLNTLAEQTANRYKISYVEKNKFQVFFINPFIRIQKLVFSNPNLSLPLPKLDKMNVLEKSIKISYIGLYFLVIIGGILGVILMMLKRKFDLFWFILISVPLIIIGTIIFNPLSIISNRYFLCAYPIFTLFIVYLLSTVFKNKIENEKI